MAVRLQRRGGSGAGGGGRDEDEGRDGWKVECEVGGADGGTAERSVEIEWAPTKVRDARRAAVSRRRGADSASIRLECCVSVLAADAAR